MKPLDKSLLCLAALLSACRMAPAQDAQPALLTNPGDGVRLELAAAIMSMSGFGHVTLANDDLTQSSELLIERTQPTDGRGGLLQGRELQEPQRFELQIQAGQCWLLHKPSGKRQRLRQAQCRATATPQ